MTLEVIPQFSSGVVSEPRSGRSYVDVNFSFDVSLDGNPATGVSLSRRSFVVRLQNPASLIDCAVQEALLRLDLSGFVLEMKVQVAFAGNVGGGGDLYRYRIIQMESHNRVALEQLIPLLMSGVLPQLDDLLRGQDAETPKSNSATTKPRVRKPLVMIANVLSFGILIGLPAAVGMSYYASMTTIESTRATLTTQQFDLVSPSDGLIVDVLAHHGEVVRRDQPLVTIRNTDIDASIAASTARISYLDATLNDAVDRNSPQTHDPQIVLSGLGTGPTNDKEVQRARDYEFALLSANLARRAGLQILSPCDCMVIWSSNPGGGAKSGDRVITLARTDANDIAVSALVPLSRALDVHAGQRASIRIPGSMTKWGATVQSVHQNVGRPPQAGADAGMLDSGDQVAVVLRPDDALDLALLGSPLQVAIHR